MTHTVPDTGAAYARARLRTGPAEHAAVELAWLADGIRSVLVGLAVDDDAPADDYWCCDYCAENDERRRAGAIIRTVSHWTDEAERLARWITGTTQAPAPAAGTDA